MRFPDATWHMASQHIPDHDSEDRDDKDDQNPSSEVSIREQVEDPIHGAASGHLGLSSVGTVGCHGLPRCAAQPTRRPCVAAGYTAGLSRRAPDRIERRRDDPLLLGMQAQSAAPKLPSTTDLKPWIAVRCM